MVEIKRILQAPYALTEIDLQNQSAVHSYDCKVRKGPAFFVVISSEVMRHSILPINPQFKNQLKELVDQNKSCDGRVLKMFLGDKY